MLVSARHRAREAVVNFMLSRNSQIDLTCLSVVFPRLELTVVEEAAESWKLRGKTDGHTRPGIYLGFVHESLFIDSCCATAVLGFFVGYIPYYRGEKKLNVACETFLIALGYTAVPMRCLYLISLNLMITLSC